MKFVWDSAKEAKNIEAHGVDFETAKLAFADTRRVFTSDKKHSTSETRFFCLGMVKGRVLTVRFTMRGGAIRIIGAGFWRAGAKLYEEQNENS